MRSLGIETSCDDTSIAIYDDLQGLLIHKTIGQEKIHVNYGGVVPELAARNHYINLTKLMKSIFKYLREKKKEKKCKKKNIDIISYTSGPGLLGSLLVGATFGSVLAYSLDIPCIAINHLEGHLLSVMLGSIKPNYPFVALIVSGGTTQLIYVKNIGDYKIIGKTLDDSVGNVFDKIAVQLNLGYPGGSKLSNLAKFGNSKKYYFPRPMSKTMNLNFSFSGLRTYTKNIIKNSKLTFQNKANIAKAFEEAVIDTLLIKCRLAIKQTNIKNLVVCGGVSLNKYLRLTFRKFFKKKKIKVFFPKKKFCTDNAAMIAYSGLLRYKKNMFISTHSISVNSKWFIDEPYN